MVDRIYPTELQLNRANSSDTEIPFVDLNLRGMFQMNCLFLSGDFKFQVSPKVLISCPRSTPRG